MLIYSDYARMSFCKGTKAFGCGLKQNKENTFSDEGVRKRERERKRERDYRIR